MIFFIFVIKILQMTLDGQLTKIRVVDLESYKTFVVDFLFEFI